MKLLNRYVLTSFVRFQLLALCSFVGLYLLIDFFEKVDNLLGASLPVIDYLLFFSAKIPLIVQQVLPLATLMAAFLTLGGLSRNSELTAMRAAGVSLLRISGPLLLAGLFLAGVTFVVSEYVTPVASLKTAAIWQKTRKNPGKKDLSGQDLWLRTGNGILYIRSTLAKENRLEGVTLYKLTDDFQIEQRVDAPFASYDGTKWQLSDAKGRTFSAKGGPTLMVAPPTQLSGLNREPGDFQQSRIDAHQMSLGHMIKKQKRRSLEGLPSNRLDVDIQARLAAPFACLVMAFLGIPFALQTGRKSSLAMGLAISVFTGVTYFVLNAMFLAFGYAGALAPMAAAWCTNLLFLLFGLWLLLSVRQ